GLCLAQAWLDQGAPAPFTLAELGPGRGTLMADVLRATRGVPGFHAGMQVVLIEASARLRGVQRDRLAGVPVTWADSAADLPDLPLFLLANEFFDALPIRQFTRNGAGWRETMVATAGDGLVRALGPVARIAALEDRLDEPPGAVVEICPAAAPVMAEIADRICAHGGAAVVVDYGGWTSRGDTFQALRDHRFADPLAEPGLADLTAHVDFAALARAAAPAASAFVTQGALLSRLGIAARAARLAAQLDGERLAAHLAATRRLTDTAEMGSLFKALAIHPPETRPPPGFETETP
ncbi:MAG: class I SAM-dependent methyltransferase, partial [Paracoccaceae bacterium]